MSRVDVTVTEPIEQRILSLAAEYHADDPPGVRRFTARPVAIRADTISRLCAVVEAAREVEAVSFDQEHYGEDWADWYTRAGFCIDGLRAALDALAGRILNG